MISLRRRLFYISFIALFFIITPLLFLYSLGYSLHNGFRLQKTGIMVIKSKPSNAKIYLNNELQQDFIKKLYKKNNHQTTPQKIKNLAPGEYNVKLELDGYWDWEKKLVIQPGQSTFAEDIVLFKKDTPIILQTGEKNISLDNDRENILSWNKKEVSIINLATNKIINIQTGSSTLPEDQKPSWSLNSQKILLENFLITIEGQILNLRDQTTKQAKNFQWDNNSDQSIYYINDTELNKYQIKEKTTTKIIENIKIKDFFIKKNYVYFLNNEKDVTTINIFDIQKEKINKKINLPLSDYSFINKEYDLLNIFDNKHNMLYIIDINSSLKQLKDSLSNISKKAYWINDNQMIYANDFEIWTYDLETSHKKLITRISKKITNIVWLPTNGHILFSTNNSINVIELDDRDKYNITKLIEDDQIKNPFLNKDGDTIYFNATINNKKGIYKLSIK